jgi:hypothetical protein
MNVEHTILDPHGTKYDNQDPSQLGAIDTQSRGERA